MTGGVGAGGGGGGDGVFTIWLISGISARRRPSDLAPAGEADVDPDAAAVTRDDPSEAVLEVLAAGGLPDSGAAIGAPEVRDESTVPLCCMAPFETVVNATSPC